MSVFLGLGALLSSILALGAFIGLSPSLPILWQGLPLFESLLFQKIYPPFLAIDGFTRALVYMGVAGLLAGGSAYCKPRRLPKDRPVISIKQRGLDGE
ncbi:MAG: hypothetical protein U0Z75_01350 [Deinococcaceae bacterium]